MDGTVARELGRETWYLTAADIERARDMRFRRKWSWMRIAARLNCSATALMYHLHPPYQLRHKSRMGAARQKAAEKRSMMKGLLLLGEALDVLHS
jgi:AraC-like DNA-binding protein